MQNQWYAYIYPQTVKKKNLEEGIYIRKMPEEKDESFLSHTVPNLDYTLCAVLDYGHFLIQPNRDEKTTSGGNLRATWRIVFVGLA